MKFVLAFALNLIKNAIELMEKLRMRTQTAIAEIAVRVNAFAVMVRQTLEKTVILDLGQTKQLYLAVILLRASSH
jgi:hypothetical protein